MTSTAGTAPRTTTATLDGSVKRSLLPTGGRLPLILEPAGPGVDLTAWLTQNRAAVEDELCTHGAILFRGFDLPTPADFERAAKAVYLLLPVPVDRAHGDAGA